VNELLHVEDVARITGLSPYTVRAAIRDGELGASKRRGRYLVTSDDLAAWIDEGRVRGVDRTNDRPHRPVARPRSTPPTGSARDAIRAIRRNAA
jgi:excisionase family DNA binding protein